MIGKLLSIQVGRVQHLTAPAAAQIDGRHPFWTSAIFKSPIKGAIQVSPTALADDQQADLNNHGGPDNIVLAYDAAHYPVWQRQLAIADLPFGSFGENFTVDGFTDESVCIGDIWRVGESLRLQVSQARQPCYKLARRLGQPLIVKLIKERGWGGWYLRVLDEGPAEAGMTITLEKRFHPDWPVATAVQIMYQRMVDPHRARQLAALPELSRRWKTELLE